MGFWVLGFSASVLLASRACCSAVDDAEEQASSYPRVQRFQGSGQHRNPMKQLPSSHEVAGVGTS